MSVIDPLEMMVFNAQSNELTGLAMMYVLHAIGGNTLRYDLLKCTTLEGSNSDVASAMCSNLQMKKKSERKQT